MIDPVIESSQYDPSSQFIPDHEDNGSGYGTNQLQEQDQSRKPSTYPHLVAPYASISITACILAATLHIVYTAFDLPFLFIFAGPPVLTLISLFIHPELAKRVSWLKSAHILWHLALVYWITAIPLLVVISLSYSFAPLNIFDAVLLFTLYFTALFGLASLRTSQLTPSNAEQKVFKTNTTLFAGAFLLIPSFFMIAASITPTEMPYSLWALALPPILTLLGLQIIPFLPFYTNYDSFFQSFLFPALVYIAYMILMLSAILLHVLDAGVDALSGVQIAIAVVCSLSLSLSVLLFSMAFRKPAQKDIEEANALNEPERQSEQSLYELYPVQGTANREC